MTFQPHSSSLTEKILRELQIGIPKYQTILSAGVIKLFTK